MYSEFDNTRPWLDTEGHPIQAHGGSIITVDDVFYWYGENKELTDGENGIWWNGVRCYSSRDLYNWRSEGIIIPADPSLSPTLAQTSQADRPHILFCKATGRFVCWIKIMEKDGTQDYTILSAAQLLGPYKLEKEHFRPFGFSGGDFDLAQENGEACIFFEKVHSEMICARLTPDHLDVEEGVHFLERSHPPFVREAPAHFARENTHYLITSGTTGYFPNPSLLCTAKQLFAAYTEAGDPHSGDLSHTSFHSQISSVFRIPGQNVWIALADRWLPDCMDIPYETVEKVFALAFSGRIAEAAAIKDTLDLPPENTSKAGYIWLPVTFENGRPQIRWYSKWKWEQMQS